MLGVRDVCRLSLYTRASTNASAGVSVSNGFTTDKTTRTGWRIRNGTPARALVGHPLSPILAASCQWMSGSCPTRESTRVGTRTGCPRPRWRQRYNGTGKDVEGCDGYVTGLKEVRRYRLSIAFSACAARQWIYHKRDGGHGGPRDKAEVGTTCRQAASNLLVWTGAGWMGAPSHTLHSRHETASAAADQGKS